MNEDVMYTHNEVLCDIYTQGSIMHMYICLCIYIWIHKHTRKYYSDIKKNKISPFVKIWVDPEGIMLSEVSQRKMNIV